MQPDILFSVPDWDNVILDLIEASRISAVGIPGIEADASSWTARAGKWVR